MGTKTAPAVRILIADDHPLFRYGLRKFLESQPGFTVVGEAGDGDEAVKLVGKIKPDILLLDVAMPRQPGLEALRELADTPTPVRTILLTAAIEKTEIVEALQLGARGVVLKESASELLLKAMHAVLDGQYWVGRESVSDLVQTLRSVLPCSAAGAPKKTYGLTPRELEIVAAVAAGASNKDIAVKFSISEATVKHHLTSIYNKVGASNRLELALFAIDRGFVGSL